MSSFPSDPVPLGQTTRHTHSYVEGDAFGLELHQARHGDLWREEREWRVWEVFSASLKLVCGGGGDQETDDTSKYRCRFLLYFKCFFARADFVRRTRSHTKIYNFCLLISGPFTAEGWTGASFLSCSFRSTLQPLFEQCDFFCA